MATWPPRSATNLPASSRRRDLPIPASPARKSTPGSPLNAASIALRISASSGSRPTRGRRPVCSLTGSDMGPLTPSPLPPNAGGRGVLASELSLMHHRAHQVQGQAGGKETGQVLHVGTGDDLDEVKPDHLSFAGDATEEVRRLVVGQPTETGVVDTGGDRRVETVGI